MRLEGDEQCVTIASGMSERKHQAHRQDHEWLRENATASCNCGIR